MADYIKDIRKKIGNMPITVCASACIITNENNEILLIRRGDSNSWALPAGILELGETVEECARRETSEETGLTLNNIEFMGVYSGKELHHIYPNGDEIYCVVNIFKSSDYSGEIVADNVESKEVRFFAKVDIPEDIHHPDKPVIIDFINGVL